MTSEAMYSGKKGADLRMEVSRLACKECGGFQDGCTCPPEWSGYPDPSDPDNYWIDDVTGERVNAETGQRTPQFPTTPFEEDPGSGDS